MDDDADFDGWYLLHHPRVVATVTAVVGRPDIAGAAADEAFVRACARWSRLGARADRTRWLHATALHLARSRSRGRPAEGAHAAGRATFAPGASPPGWPPALWAALGALPAREREALALHHVGGLPPDAVADLMGVAASTVTTALQVGRGRLAPAVGAGALPPEAAAPGRGASVPDIAAVLARLAESPPHGSGPVAAIRARAGRQARRRRHQRLGATGLVAAGLVAAGVVALRGGPDGSATAGSRPAGEVPVTATLPGGDVVLRDPAGLSVAPDAALGATALVELTVDGDPGGRVAVLQCRAEVVAEPPTERVDRLDLCGPLRYLREGTEPGEPGADMSLLRVEVARELVTPAGTVDCATAPGRCVVAVRIRWSDDEGEVDERFAPLAFDPDAPPPGGGGQPAPGSGT